MNAAGANTMPNRSWCGKWVPRNPANPGQASRPVPSRRRAGQQRREPADPPCHGRCSRTARAKSAGTLR
jgi:hypothetical protein